MKLWHVENPAKKKFPFQRSSEQVPSGAPEISDFNIQERQEEISTEGACGVQVGVICGPACHDLFVMNQAVAGPTSGTAGDQDLGKGTELKPQETFFGLGGHTMQ